MSTIIIQTESETTAAEILAFVKKLQSISSVEIEHLETSLAMNDWAKPGRAATSNELETLAELMVKESTFKDVDAIF
jgi:hypothetical protein